MTLLTGAGGTPQVTGDLATQLPELEPVRLLDSDGTETGAGPLPPPELRLELYRAMVVGRRFDRQATVLTKQGRLAVYPSSHGQEACQVGAVTALTSEDWLFPTYRECMALVTRGLDPVETLSLLRGDWHCGYDPHQHRTAPLCTPLATQTLHAVGLAHAARLAGDRIAALAFVGDGATSEGDFHEALNFGAVYRAPAVFLVQNNQYAISVPLAKQSAAPSLAHKAIGYGLPGIRVDGNDVLAVHSVVSQALEAARSGRGPTLVEAMTYRIEAHTNADDATRYRDPGEVEAWRERDPVDRLARHLRRVGLLDDALQRRYEAEAEEFADRLRTRMHADPELDPMAMFDHVYAAPTPQLAEQAAQLRAELAAENEGRP